MLVLWRLFGLLVRERSVLKLVGANLKDGQNVLVGVGRRHRRGRRRWHWRPGRRWGSAPSVTSNMMEPVPSRPFVVAVNQQCRT